ncbi:MAG: hypothetical protein MUD10_00490 [Candidatus Pacebacteria bacterium]|nr:hypothetical protein [Candidatus Paceibacterota bacterium]
MPAATPVVEVNIIDNIPYEADKVMMSLAINFEEAFPRKWENVTRWSEVEGRYVRNDAQIPDMQVIVGTEQGEKFIYSTEIVNGGFCTLNGDKEIVFHVREGWWSPSISYVRVIINSQETRINATEFGGEDAWWYAGHTIPEGVTV